MPAPAGALLDRCRFPDDRAGPVPLGVSGGADSVAMALLAAESGLRFTIWHVDHGLRSSSAVESGMVARLATMLGVPFEHRPVALVDGPDLEARARRARYEVLPADVCVAHTADDRAETILMHLFRGAGPAGVATPMDLVHRPLLALRRHETRTLCAAAGVAVVDDEHNDDPRFTRVRVRHELLPLVVDIFARDPVPLLVRHADQVADALSMVRADAAAVDPTVVADLRAAPVPVAAEAIRSWIRRETGAPHSVDAASIARVRSVVAGEIKATEVTGGHRIARSQGRLAISLASPDGQART